MKEVISRIYLPEWVHRQMKTITAQRGISNKEYLIELVMDAIIRDIKKLNSRK